MSDKKTRSKWFCPIWKDPLRWGRSVGGSDVHAMFAAFIHFFVFLLAAGMGLLVAGPGNIAPCLGLVGPLFLIFVALPGCYIYVIYRLIAMIDEDQARSDEGEALDRRATVT